MQISRFDKDNTNSFIEEFRATVFNILSSTDGRSSIRAISEDQKALLIDMYEKACDLLSLGEGITEEEHDEVSCWISRFIPEYMFGTAQ